MDPLDYPAGPEDEADDDTYTVRPYAVVGGRTRTTTAPLPVETLIQSLGTHDGAGLTLERRRILDLTAQQYLSVAELSAHVHLPVGVVRILVGDLADEGHVRIHGSTPGIDPLDPSTSLSVLESVLNGISSL
ncbi:MAG: DUF742 domain-containing protein [Angustibacter sp.]